MTGIVACVATVLLGVEAGWKPMEGGGVEYTLQIEPGLLEALNRGESFDSYVTPQAREILGDIRMFRVVVGQGKLAQEKPKAAAPDPALAGPALGAAGNPPTGSPYRSARPSPLETSRSATAWPSTFAPVRTEKQPVAPATLPANLEGKRMPAEQADFKQPVAEGANPETKAQPAESSPPVEPAKPWPLLWAAVLALGASLTGNVYLGWIYHEARHRCRALLGRTGRAAMVE